MINKKEQRMEFKRQNSDRESQWSERRVRHLQTWVVQLARSATIMARAASWLGRTGNLLVFLSQFCTSYTSIIPVATISCALVEDDKDCIRLQISAIAFAFLGSLIALLEGKWALGEASVKLQQGSRQVMKLARLIDLQLQRDENARDSVDSFCQEISEQYDDIMLGLPSVPRLLFKKEDLINLTLLSAYIDAPNTPDCPPLDEMLSQKMQYELERIGTASVE
jgi:hypothetical protein